MRFLFLACDFPPGFGGIQKLSYGLCQALQQSGHDVTVIASAQRGDDEFDARSGLKTVRRPINGMLRGALAVGGAVCRVVRETRPDVVVATKWAPEGPGYMRAGIRGRVPLVLMGHGREFLPESHRPIRACVQRAVVRAASGAVVNSHYTMSQMVASGMPQDRVRVVHPGVDPDEFTASPDLNAARQRMSWPDGPTLLSIGRLIERKGVDTVISALPIIHKSLPDAHHVIIGSGPHEDSLRALASEIGVDDHVHFLGAVGDEQKSAAVQLCSAFVMPSRDIPTAPPEGFGIVYLEANLCGKPVIAARTGGVEDAVEHGVNGLLIEPGSPEQVAAAAVALLGDADAAGAMGERGRERALERFAWPVIAPQFAGAVSSILASGGTEPQTA